MALAAAGAEVVAVEVDGRLIGPLTEAVAGFKGVRVVRADAMTADWGAILGPTASWILVANLPYNVAVPVVMGLLDTEPRVERMLVMVQREVGERLAAGPGDPQYGAVSVRVAYRAQARVVRRVPPTVFWPRPSVESVLISMVRHAPTVEVSEPALWTVVREAFGQRRKTLRGALVRLGMSNDQADLAMRECGIELRVRPEEVGLDGFACLARRCVDAGLLIRAGTAGFDA